jgi:hypothetical protein
MNDGKANEITMRMHLFRPKAPRPIPAQMELLLPSLPNQSNVPLRLPNPLLLCLPLEMPTERTTRKLSRIGC